MAMVAAKALREGSARKRADILTAARERFLADGFDGTSVDAISATAGVSKRTVYDYFGDKQSLLTGVIQACSSALMSTIRDAIDEYLGSPTNLEAGLVGFADRIISTTLTSSDYATLITLVTKEAVHLPARHADYWMASEPEEIIAERFAEFDSLGLMDAPKPRLAADHFVALTFAIPLEVQRDTGDPVAIHQSIVDAVQAFLRAYGPGSQRTR